MNLQFALFSAINVALVLLLSPLFSTIIKKIKAFTQRRKGPVLMQGYYNLLKLFKKEVVYSTNSSLVSRVTPYVNISALVVATLFVPLVFIPPPVDYVGSIILFVYLLALAKFFMALGGLDAGSTFGGMGSSREMTISSILEPIMILVFAAFAFVLKTTNIHEMLRIVSGAGVLLINPLLIPLSLALFIILITETSRIPVDNPETHLELTMVHEAMILEQSGRNLAFMELSHAIKQTLLMAIFINIFFPIGFATNLDLASLIISVISFLAKGAILSVAVGIFESSFAKARFFRLPGMLVVAFFLSLLTILLVVFK